MDIDQIRWRIKKRGPWFGVLIVLVPAVRTALERTLSESGNILVIAGSIGVAYFLGHVILNWWWRGPQLEIVWGGDEWGAFCSDGRVPPQDAHGDKIEALKKTGEYEENRLKHPNSTIYREQMRYQRRVAVRNMGDEPAKGVSVSVSAIEPDLGWGSDLPAPLRPMGDDADPPTKKKDRIDPGEALEWWDFMHSWVSDLMRDPTAISISWASKRIRYALPKEMQFEVTLECSWDGGSSERKFVVASVGGGLGFLPSDGDIYGIDTERQRRPGATIT